MSLPPAEPDPYAPGEAMAPMRAAVLLSVVIAAVIPAFVLRFSSLEAPAGAAAAIFGLGIVAAAFLLAWGA